MNITVFSSLIPALQELLHQEGITTPTRAQKLAIPIVLKDNHILLIAPTGSGKTEAAVLPLLHQFITTWHNDVQPDNDDTQDPKSTKKKVKVKKRPFKGISILYVTPLRALNRDMMSRLKIWGEKLGIEVAVRHGDTTQKERQRLGKQPPNMLITTPETLQILLISKNLKEHLRYVRAIVIDEVHELAPDERGAQLAVALERLEEITYNKLLRIGLSATVGTPEEIAKYLGGIGRTVKVVKAIDLKELSVTVESPVPDKHDNRIADALALDNKVIASMRRIEELIKKHRSTLIFINTRDGAESLAARFKLNQTAVPIGVHHGSLSRDVRIQMEDNFKAEQLKGLICTSSLELGIDIGSADYTVQYNSPREVTRLIQRVGRSGHRLGEVSEGMVIATNPDEIAESMIIARRLKAEQLEHVVIRQNPLGVLANQLAAFAMAQRRVKIEDAFMTVTKSYPFRNLKMSKFLEVLAQMREVHAIWVDFEEFGKKRNTIEYFYDNISMIPDEKTFNIIDITTRQHVGQLDEAFVSVYIMPMAKFIIKGEPWRVVEVTDDEKILVEPASELGAVPGWIGEEIPVPYEVAQEVGTLRRELENKLSGQNIDNNQKQVKNKVMEITPELFREQLKRYPVDWVTLKIYIDYINTQLAKFIVPTDRVITIDVTQVPEPIIIINACFGSKVNETIGQLLSALIASRLGASVGVRTDPYRIILELSARINPKIIKDYIMQLNPKELEQFLRLVLKNSSYLKWQLLHVARKFGAIEKDLDHKAVNIGRLLDNFMNSPLYDEAIDKILWEKLDIRRTQAVLEQLQSDKLILQLSQLSHIGKLGLEVRKDLMAPEKADRAILLALKKRLEKDYVRLICLNCQRTQRRTIANVKDRVRCNHCNGVLLAVIPRNDTETERLLKKKGKLAQQERRELKRLRTNANLVMSHGKRALLTMAARGVGANTAAKILRKLHEDEFELLRDILKAEVNYARTRRFWD